MDEAPPPSRPPDGHLLFCHCYRWRCVNKSELCHLALSEGQWTASTTLSDASQPWRTKEQCPTDKHTHTSTHTLINPQRHLSLTTLFPFILQGCDVKLSYMSVFCRFLSCYDLFDLWAITVMTIWFFLTRPPCPMLSHPPLSLPLCERKLVAAHPVAAARALPSTKQFRCTSV